MKNIKYIILTMGIIILSSCSDFFDTKSPSAMDVSVFNNPRTTEQVIFGVYDLFGQDKSFRNRLCGGYVSNNTDIEYGNKSSGNAPYNNYTLGTGTGDVSTTNGKDPWAYLTTGIERINIAIDGIERLSDTTKVEFQYLLGEALTLRAFIYLEMIKLWGDVPANFKPIDVADENGIFSPKVDRNIIFEQLRVDLTRASNLMDWSEDCPGAAKNNVGRPSKGYALGLLAKVDLMYAGKALRPDYWTGAPGAPYGIQYNITDPAKRLELYKEAMEACAQVINKENSKLQTTFKDVFVDICSDVTTYSETESMFELNFADGARGQVLNLCGLKSKDANTYLVNTTSSSNTNSMIMVVPTFIFDFEANDTRKNVTVAPFKWNKYTVTSADDQLKYSGAAINDKVLYTDMQTIEGCYLGKYRFEWMVRSTASSDDGVNLVLMRYSDILLMFAEAAIGGIDAVAPVNTTGLDGLVQLNKVRTRAFGNTTHNLLSYTIDDIIKERAFEFCGENIRKYDLMRWGMLKSKIDETTTRIANLEAHSGEYIATADTIYYKLKRNDALAISPTKGYEIDSIFGFAKGEVGAPPTYNKNNGWVKSNFYYSTTTGRVLSPTNYFLFATGVNVDNHQLWPLFDINVNASNGALWNDYEY